MKQTTISGCLLVYCRLAVCLSAIPLLSGCVIPYPHTTLRSKEVTGTVLDARTRAPIKGARVVQSEHSINGAKPKTRATTTNASGRFKLPTSHNFHLAIGSGGERFEDLPPGHVYEEVTIFSPGYLSYQMKGYGDVKILLQPVHSLEVAGRVLDSRTMAPVVGARVYFANQYTVVCSSDSTGHFRWKATAEFYHEYRAREASPLPVEDWVVADQKGYDTAQWHCGDKADVRNGNILVQLEQSTTSSE